MNKMEAKDIFDENLVNIERELGMVMLCNAKLPSHDSDVRNKMVNHLRLISKRITTIINTASALDAKEDNDNGICQTVDE